MRSGQSPCGCPAAVEEVRHSLSACSRVLWGRAIHRGPEEPRLLTTPLRFDRELADRVMRAANGQPWHWRPGRSELSTIGSYTRSCRMIDDPERAGVLIREASQRPSST